MALAASAGADRLARRSAVQLCAFLGLWILAFLLNSICNFTSTFGSAFCFAFFAGGLIELLCCVVAAVETETAK